CRADMPAADAFKTRIRRSSLRACPIIHFSAVDVESASVALVTSQSIHQSQDMSRSTARQRDRDHQQDKEL
ncbi:hypothetical protein, partial [Rhizobium anhuiense]